MKTIVVCPKCDGKGYIKDYLYALFTVGLAWLAGDIKDRCTRCDGAGKIVKQLKEEL